MLPYVPEIHKAVEKFGGPEFVALRAYTMMNNVVDMNVVPQSITSLCSDQPDLEYRSGRVQLLLQPRSTSICATYANSSRLKVVGVAYLSECFKFVWMNCS